jgi:hypothetical protein
MKRPQKGDSLKIKSDSTSEIIEETCSESRPDESCPPNGVEFVIVTKRDYQMHVQYWLIGDAGDELGASVVRVARSPTLPGWKRIVFSTIIPSSQ